MEIRSTNNNTKKYTNTGARIEGKLSMHPTTPTIVTQPGMSELFIKSTELCRSITYMFKQTFADYQGTIVKITPNPNTGIRYVTVELVFKLMSQDEINKLPDDGKFVAFTILGANLHQKTRSVEELYSKINIWKNVNAAMSRGGSKYAVGITQDAKDILSDFLLPNNNMKVEWENIITAQDSYDVKTNTEQTQVSVKCMDILKVIAAARGHKDDNNFGYSIAALQEVCTVPQQMNMGMMSNIYYQAMANNDWILDIRELDCEAMSKVKPDNNYTTNYQGAIVCY